MRFAGQTAIVTGGTKGIGLAIAERLKSEGATVYAWGRKSVDVTDPMAIAGALDNIGPVDVLINNAGIFGPVQSSLTYQLAEWDAVMRTNLTSQLMMCQRVVPGMVKRGYGRVVNMSSVVAKDVNPLSPAYTCSKAAVVALTKCLGRELAKTGVTVNCVTPSACRTSLFDGVAEDYIQAMLKKVPMERFVTVEEIAALVCWIASKECSGTTASVFDVSGGRAQF